MLISSSAGPLRVLVAPDSFKGSLTAREAADAIAAGLTAALGDEVAVESIPMADGGEGTLDALLARPGAREHRSVVADALGRPRSARWVTMPDGLAVIEAAEANGLLLVRDAEPRPLDAGSEGVGAIVRAALDAGATGMLLTVGGSASTDGGVGLLRALGARFLDARGAELPAGGGPLGRLARIDLSGLHERARSIPWRIACDVDNPLTGPHGAAAVFAPQKGADADQVRILDDGLLVLARALRQETGVDVERMPGTGAAGGIPASLHAVLEARLVPGADLVADALDLDAALARADLVITGEGSLDAQSLRGKVPAAVARRAAAKGRPVVAMCGAVRLTPAELRAAGIAVAMPLADGPALLDDLLDRAALLLRDAAFRLGALLRLGGATMPRRHLGEGGDAPGPITAR